MKAAGDIPLTVKMRKGIDSDHLTYLEAGRIAEGAGVAAVALHARTAAEFYSGQADWSAIAKLKETVTSVPVLGNGDIWSADDALRMVDETGCDGVVVGRGCLGRPWLFGDLAAAFRGEDTHAPSRASARSRRRSAGTPSCSSSSSTAKSAAAATSASTSPGTSRATRSAATCARASRPSSRSRSSTTCSARSTGRCPTRARAPRARAAAPARPKNPALPDGWLDSQELVGRRPRHPHRGRSSTPAAAEMRERLFGGYDDADAERWLPEEHSSRRSDFARDRARLLHSSALRRLAAKTQVLSPDRRPRLRPQPAHALARGRPGRPRARHEPRPRPRRRRHRVPRARPRPPAVRAQRREGAQRLGGRHRRLRGQRADAAPAHPARAEGVRRRRPQLRAQPHPGEPRRELQVPVARQRRASPTRAAGRSSASTTTTSTCSAGCARALPTAGSASRRRSWTSPTTSPTRCTTSRTRSSAATSTSRRSARASTTTSSSPRCTSGSAARSATTSSSPRSTASTRSTSGSTRWDGSRRDQARLKNLTSQLIGRFAHAATEATRAAFPLASLIRFDADVIVPREIQAEIAVLKGIVAAFVMSKNTRQPIYHAAARSAHRRSPTCCCETGDAAPRPGLRRGLARRRRRRRTQARRRRPGREPHRPVGARLARTPRAALMAACVRRRAPGEPPAN